MLAHLESFTDCRAFLQLYNYLMKLFRIFKKQRHLGHGQASDVPTTSEASDVPAPNTSSHPVGAEILVHGIDPIIAE